MRTPPLEYYNTNSNGNYGTIQKVKHRKNCECCLGHSSCLKSSYTACSVFVIAHIHIDKLRHQPAADATVISVWTTSIRNGQDHSLTVSHKTLMSWFKFLNLSGIINCFRQNYAFLEQKSFSLMQISIIEKKYWFRLKSISDKDIN